MAQGTLHFAERGRVLIVAISAAPSVGIIERIDDALAQLRLRHPEGVFVVFVRHVPARARPKAPSAQVRERMVALVRRHRAGVCGLAYVLPRAGRGTWLVRAMMAPLLGALPFPARLFARDDEASRWLTSDPRLGVSGEELSAALLEGRRALL